MNEISGGSAGDPEGSVDAAFNLWHEVGDWTFFDATLFVVFNPQVSSDGEQHRTQRIIHGKEQDRWVDG